MPVKTDNEVDVASTVSKLAVQVDTLQKVIPTMAGVVDADEVLLNQKTILLCGSLQ